jgi:hypothetical protein
VSNGPILQVLCPVLSWSFGNSIRAGERIRSYLRSRLPFTSEHGWETPMTNVAATAGRELGGDIPSHLAFLAHRRPVPSSRDSLHSSECYCKSPLARSRWRALSSKCRVTLARLVHPFLGPVRPVSSGANKGIAQMPDQGILSLQSNLSLRVPLRCRELVSERRPSIYSTVLWSIFNLISNTKLLAGVSHVHDPTRSPALQLRIMMIP